MVWFRRKRDPTVVLLEQLVHQLLYQGKIIMADLTRLNAAVAANTEATNAAVTAINNLKASSDQAAIDAAAQTIETNNQTLITASSSGTA